MKDKEPGEAPPLRQSVLFELGHGGMGSVHLAVAGGPAGFRKLKVVKQLRRDLAEDPRFVQMFLDEARLAARLNHPNVVQTFEVGFESGRFFLEMEYLEGKSLEELTQQLARSSRPFPRPLALWIVSQVLAGLHYAHELTDVAGNPLGVVHRDVSPHNVLLTYEGAVKVLDFGIAKAADAAGETKTGEMKGKPTYMAPEQAFGRPIDRSADVFSAGVVLWQLLTNRRLWAGMSNAQIFVQLDHGTIPSPRSLDPTVPPALDALCRRATGLRPESRFPTAAAMQEAIEEALEDTRVRAGPRQLAALMNDVCGEARAAARLQVEQRLRELGAPESPGARSVRPGSLMNETRAAPGAANLTSRHEAPLPSPELTSAPPTTTPRLSSGHASPERVSARPSSRRTWQAVTFSLAAMTVAGALLAAGVVKGRSAPPIAAALAPEPPCTRSSACTASAGGAPSVCNPESGRCVELASNDCHVIADPSDGTNDRTLWLGTMFPTSAPNADQNGQVYERGVALARDDFAKVTRGIPQRDGVGDPRPVGLVACDSFRDPDRAAHHLVDDVGVPAIIGFGSSQKLIELASSLFLPKRVLAMSASDGSAYVSTIPHPAGSERLVWRTTMDFWGVNKPAANLVSQVLEPDLRARGVVRRGEAIRVALVREDSLTGLSTSDAILGALVINGKTALANGHDFEEIVVKPDPESYSRAIETLLRLAPHIVLFSAGDDDLHAVLLPLEDRWPARARARPLYLQDTTLGGRGLFALFAKHPDVRKRMFGMYGPLKTEANQRFTKRFDESATTPLAYTMVPGSAYDAFYVLAYAAFVAPDARLTGPGLAAGIRRLIPPGESLEVGPGKIFTVLDLLRQGKNVDLVGTATTLDFDLATGDAMGDVVLDCERWAPVPASFEAEEIPVVYRASTHTWTGHVECPW